MSVKAVRRCNWHHVYLYVCTDRSFILDVVGEICFEDIGVRGEHLDDRFGKTFHVPLPDLRILAFQLLEHLKTLCQLREDIYHWVGEIGMLSVLLKLKRMIRFEKHTLKSLKLFLNEKTMKNDQYLGSSKNSSLIFEDGVKDFVTAVQ